MKKLITITSFLLFIIMGFSQEEPDVKIDSMLVNIDKSSFTSGILYERVFPYAKLNIFNDSINVSSTKHFEQALTELYKSSNEQKFISYKNLRNYYTDKKTYDKVDIGIISASFHQLNYVKTDEQKGALKIIDDKFQKIENDKEIFKPNEILIISPLKQYVTGNEIMFHFDDVFLLEENGNKTINNIVANFDTAQDYTIYENGNFTNSNLSVNYTETGYKILTFLVTFNDDSTKTTQGIIHFKRLAQQVNHPIANLDNPFISNISFQGYDESNPIFGQLEWRVFYATNNTNNVLLKPLIIIDGFDPQDGRKIEDSDPHDGTDTDHRSIVDIMIYFDSNGVKQDIIPELQNLGYDVIIVNHPEYTRNGVEIDGGADYIERNGRNHASFYQAINERLEENNSEEELVIVGPSMGGQISRYALAYMEKNGIDHNCRLWLSVDSPHLGANIPMGIQSGLNQVNDETDNNQAENFVDNWLGSAAARQQLIEQFNGWNGQHLNQDYLDARTISQGYSVDRGHPFFIQFYDNMFNNGLANSKGYPQNVRKVALVNGSMTGTKEYFNPFIGQDDNFLNDSDIATNIRAFQTIAFEVCAFGVCVSHSFDIHIGSFETYGMPSYGNSSKISRFKKLFNDKTKHITNINSRGNMDNMSGGFFDGFNAIVDGQDGSDPVPWPAGSFMSFDNFFESIFAFFSDLFGGANNSLRDNEYVNSFIPTVSALGFNNPDFYWHNDINRNLICSNEIPFDNYYAPRKNEQHTSFTQESFNWFKQELAGNNPSPTVYLDSNDILGEFAICQNNNEEYSFTNCKITSTPTWQVSSNLNIIGSNTNTSVIVESNTANKEFGFIRAVFNDQTIEKQVWLNEPEPPTTLNGLEEVQTGTFATYSGGNANGATSYEWLLPYPFDVVQFIDNDSDNWQIRANDLNRTHVSVYTGEGAINGLVQIMSFNSCNQDVDFGPSKNIYVIHADCPPGELCDDDIGDLRPYPNTANENFKIDFRNKPASTQFYIYIYDQYSNIKYSGESNNVEKTIDTMNLPNGIYYLHIVENGETTIKHLFINH